MSELEPVRIDKWLWFVRLFKTRALARQAIIAGHVRLNGVRVKPARTVSIGDALDITTPVSPRSFVVKGLPRRRGPAAEAKQMYEESAESIEKWNKAIEERKLQRVASPHPERRPDKRDRRRIIRFTRG